MAFGFGTNYGRNAQSFEIYEQDRTRRETNPSFRDFHPVEYVSGFEGNSKKANYKWESSVLYDLPKTYGRSYNDKFDSLMDEMGIPFEERDGFRKYLDAEEKGKLGSSLMDEIANDFKFRTPGKIPGAEYIGGYSDKKKPEPERSLLDRSFDALLVGNYASAGLADGVVNKGSWKEGWKQAWQGVKAANPFGKGDESSEYTYSKVLENAGWKPDDNIERFNKGAAGFALDILLDPTTYLTLGASALIKGTGKVGAGVGKLGTGVVEALDANKAKDIVKSAMSKRGIKLTDEELARDAERLAKKYNELRGVGREAKDVTVGLGNMPFGDKVFGKTLSKTAKLGTNKPLQAIGDMTFAKPYAIARDFIYGSKIGQKLSPKHPLYMMAKEDPAKLADALKAIEITSGLHVDKIGREKALREYVKKNLGDLTPDENRQILELLQDRTVMADVKRMVKLSETQESKLFAQKLTQRKDLAAAKLKTLLEDQKTLEDLKSGYEDGILDLNDELKTAEYDMVEQLKQIDLEAIDDDKLVGQALDAIRKKSSELEAQFEGLASPVKPKLNIPDEPVQPKRPYNRRPKPPEYEEVPDLKVDEVSASREIDPIHNGVVERWNKSDKGAEQKLKTVDELSQLVYGETGRISKATYPAQIDELVDALKTSGDVEELKWMIDQKPHFYDGRATDIYRHMGDKYGYGSGREHQNWKEFYEERMKPLTAKLEKGEKLTPGERKLVENLEKIRLERARDVEILKEKSKEELSEYLRKENEQKLMKDFEDIENSNYNAGGYDVVKDETTGELRAVIRDKDARMSAEELDAQRRDKSIAHHRDGDLSINTSARDEIVDEFSKTHGWESKVVEANDVVEEWKKRRLSLNNDEFDEIKGKVLAVVAKDGKINKNHIKYANSVLEEVEPILKDVFKKPYEQLSQKQKDFLLTMAKQNAFKKGTGAKSAQDNMLAKKALEVAEKRQKADLVKAVEKRTQVGSTVFFKQGDKLKGGEVLAVGRDFDDFLEYKVMGHNGKQVTIKPENITRVESMKPQDILLQELTKEVPSPAKQLADETAEVNARNIQREMDYMDELDEFEKKKADKKAQYQEDMAEFHVKHQEWIENKELSEKLHQADLKSWKEAAIQSSELAKNLFNQKKLLQADMQAILDDTALKPMRRDMRKQDIIKAHEAHVDSVTNAIKNLEMSHAQLSDLLKKGDVVDPDEVAKLQENVRKAEDALSDDDALETLMRASMGDNKADAIVHMYSGQSTGQIVLDSRLDVSDKVKALVKELRKSYQEIGKREVKDGVLNHAQLNKFFENYVPHILTPEGEKFFKNKKITYDANGEMVIEDKLLGGKGVVLTDDYGYGQKFNPHGISRTIKKIKMPNGKWIDEPTIEQINESLAPVLKGKNVFSENVADIYLARMLKHSELVYDQDYMRNMMNIFGDELKPGSGVKDGFVAVANFGLVEKRIKELTNVRYMNSQMTGTKLSREDARQEVLQKMGLSDSMLDEFATPMLELSEEQIRKMQSVDPSLVRQVNNAIALKANQSRKLQIAKDQSRFLQLYDKFTHLMKLNQTTVMPAFHARNKFSNMYLNYLDIGRDAVNPKFQRAAWRAAKHQGNPEKLADLGKVNINGTDMGWDELYDLAKAHQVIDEGFFAKDLGAGTATGGIKGGKLDPTDSENFFAYRMGGEFGNKVENSDRLIHFVSQLKNGKSVEEARESVEKYLFDYSDLTAFEQSVMKRIFPYYTWLRKNGRLQVDQVIENPGRMRDVDKAMNMVEGGINEEDKLESRYMSDFAKDWKQTAFTYKKKDEEGNVIGEEPILWNPNLPFMDLTRLPDPTRPVDSAITAFTQTVPQLKVPIEQALNKNFFFDDRIVDKDATGKEAAMARGQHAAMQFAGFTAGEGIMNKEGVDKALHALNVLSGQKYLSYDYEMSKRMAIAKEKGAMIEDEVPVDKLLRKVRNPKSFLSKEFRDAYAEETNHITQSLDNWIHGEASESDKENYAPLIKALAETASTVGIEEAKAKTFTRSVLEFTSLDGHVLGKDFTKGTVTEVIDGDTVRVKFGAGKEQKVRLLYVDTPETKDPDFEGKMPMGQEASDYTKSVLQGGDVQLVIDNRQKDGNGRLLAYIYHNGRDFNNDVLSHGLGKVRYTNFSDEQYKVDKYKATQRDAAQAKRGIWGIDGYATESDSGYNEAIARRYRK